MAGSVDEKKLFKYFKVKKEADLQKKIKAILKDRSKVSASLKKSASAIVASAKETD